MVGSRRTGAGLRIAILAALVGVMVAGAGAPSAVAAAVCPGPVAYPGDAAPKPAIARWLAAGAVAAGIPAELPVMGALVESGLTNLRPGAADAAGYFAQRTAIWDSGPYAGFPDRPELQLQWFLDLAAVVRRRQLALGARDPAADETRLGAWAADVLRPAEQQRYRYALRLADARALIGLGCPAEPPQGPVPPDAFQPQAAAPPLAPVEIQPPAPAPPLPPVHAGPAPDAVAPALRVDGAGRQRITGRTALLVGARCPDEACTLSATATVALPRRRSVRLRSAARRAAAGQAVTLRLALTRGARTKVRRALRAGRRLRAVVRVLATDDAGNRTTATPTIRLTG